MGNGKLSAAATVAEAVARVLVCVCVRALKYVTCHRQLSLSQQHFLATIDLL